MRNVYRELERRVQLDEGNRGIQAIIPSEEQLYPAATSILNCNSVGILTGFPCLLNQNPPIESDGISGALFLGKVLQKLNKPATILIESYQAMQELVQWYNLENSVNIQLSNSMDLHFEGIVAIERAGRAKDGNYYTMRGIQMPNVQPFDTVYLDEKPCKAKVSIGDGGNEAGLGIFQSLVEENIKLGSTIASTSKSDYGVVCSVSTWGGWALGVAMCLEAGIEVCLEPDQERTLAQKLVELGIRDGVTAECSLSIDGMDWAVSNQVILDLLQISKG